MVFKYLVPVLNGPHPTPYLAVILKKKKEQYLVPLGQAESPEE